MDEKSKGNRPPLNPPVEPVTTSELLPDAPADNPEQQAQQVEQDKNWWQRNTNAGGADKQNRSRERE